VLRRVGRLGDGWFPQMLPDRRAGEMLDRLRDYAVGAGRDPSRIGVEARIELRYGEPSTWPALVEVWRGLGDTHLAISTRGLGLTGAGHLTEIERLHRELVA
jgi:hypothetical protein